MKTTYPNFDDKYENAISLCSHSFETIFPMQQERIRQSVETVPFNILCKVAVKNLETFAKLARAM